jgi:putative membrane protein
MLKAVKKEKTYIRLIGVLSVVVPLLVAVLLFMPTKVNVGAEWVSFLPHLNAVINSATSLALVAGLVFIKQKNIAYHRMSMMTAFILGGIFLVSYVIYHSTSESTVFGDLNGNGVLEATESAAVGSARTIYLIVLISHIVLAAIVLPFVLMAMYYALTDKIKQHKKIVKLAFPIWLYVSVTGVIVYLMISPYYQ